MIITGIQGDIPCNSQIDTVVDDLCPIVPRPPRWLRVGADPAVVITQLVFVGSETAVELDNICVLFRIRVFKISIPMLIIAEFNKP